MSSPNQTPDPPITLDGISKQVSELGRRIDSLAATYTGLPEQLTANQNQFLESVKAKSQSNKSAWIPAWAGIMAAVITVGGAIFNSRMTSQTNTALTRITTLQSENAKRGLDIYYLAQDQIANLEQAFETFLLEKKLTPQNAAPRLGSDLNRMCIASRFGLKTALVKDYNDFIFETISGLQRNPERWKDVEALRKEAQDKCQQAIKALDDLEQGT